jgi:beta-phosphoglucomutase
MSGVDLFKACIFDLDGVLVDTAKYHFLAWRRLAASLGYELQPEDEERLKGVSRMESLEIVLGIGGIRCDEDRKLALADRKNDWYRESIKSMDSSELLPGARLFVEACETAGLKTGLASSSKNAGDILRSTGIEALFGAVVDGNAAARAKPAPDLFLAAASALGAAPGVCVVFEDAAAGIAAARAAGMASIGLGNPSILEDADIVIPGLAGVDPATLLASLAEGGAGRRRAEKRDGLSGH